MIDAALPPAGAGHGHPGDHRVLRKGKKGRHRPHQGRQLRGDAGLRVMLQPDDQRPGKALMPSQGVGAHAVQLPRHPGKGGAVVAQSLPAGIAEAARFHRRAAGAAQRVFRIDRIQQKGSHAPPQGGDFLSDAAHSTSSRVIRSRSARAV